MPGGVGRRWRPSLGLVIGGTLAATLLVGPAGVAAVWLLDGRLGLGWTALVVALGAGAVTAVLGWLLWRLLLGPVWALAERAEAVGRGGPPRPVRHYGTREMRELGRAVLGMAERLRGREAVARSFADHVSHELKGPIAAVRGAAEMLEEDGADARLTGAILAAAARMDVLLGRLREVAALREAGAGPATLAAEAGTAAAAGLEVAVEGGGVALPLSPEALHVVVAQMAGNAAAHGARRLRLAARAEGPELVVEDDGEGIAAGDVGRVFDPFFTTRREAGGTGMGLYVVRTLIGAHGGRIEAAAREGGARFVIRW